jgi:TPR repeat protein
LQQHCTNVLQQYIELSHSHVHDIDAKGNLEYIIGRLYDEGFAAEHNHEQSVSYWRRSATLGNHYSENALAIANDKARGIPVRDVNAAFEYWMKSAQHGNSLAQRSLATCYKGEPFPYVDGTDHSLCISSIVMLFTDGKGVTKDETTAFEWLQRAAQDGTDSWALHDLGTW